ncbi:hypothetical protein [Hymenobacter mucosus]|uniref:SpoIIAA-like n=1 Tax=Hymenobacter mucosus TaxID=1411120 RepID=A0A238WZP1_9BACT|nr:hypothetical protein [Hymenobacter mucosus]SNR51069.1 hypothetical protein SAMN06269173_103218 [Hymenobacter mucosus]
MLPNFLSDTTPLHTTYRPDLHVLVSRWNYQPDASQLPPAYEFLTQDALAHDCRFWLQDIRRRTLNEPEVVQWMLESYFPSIATHLGGRLMVAYLANPSLLQTIQGSSYPSDSSYSTEAFDVQFFTDEAAAMQWLQESTGLSLTARH